MHAADRGFVEHRCGYRIRVRRLLRQNSLGITVVACFLMLWLGGQTTAGYRTYNQERVLDGQPSVSLVTYLSTSHFGEATFENWKSEILQRGMYVADRVTTWSYLTRSRCWFESLQNWQSEFLAGAAIVLLTIVLRQHGSPESKPVHAAHTTTG